MAQWDELDQKSLDINDTSHNRMQLIFSLVLVPLSLTSILRECSVRASLAHTPTSVFDRLGTLALLILPAMVS